MLSQVHYESESLMWFLDNESLLRSATLVIQTKVNSRKWRRSLKARIQLIEGDDEGDDEIIVDTVEFNDERYGYIMIDPKGDNKSAECRGEGDNEECFFVTLLYFGVFATHFCNRPLI